MTHVDDTRKAIPVQQSGHPLLLWLSFVVFVWRNSILFGPEIEPLAGKLLEIPLERHDGMLNHKVIAAVFDIVFALLGLWIVLIVQVLPVYPVYSKLISIARSAASLIASG
jgi:hypothetical protein